MQHARLSPSGADRWMICSASVPLIERLLAAGEIKENDLEDHESVTEDEIIDLGLDAYEDVVLDGNRESDSFSAVVISNAYESLTFGTEHLAAAYLGVNQGSVHSARTRAHLCKGYKVEAVK